MNFASEILTICNLWIITARDGDQIMVTDHDGLIIVGDDVFQPFGFQMQSSTATTSFSIANQNIETPFIVFDRADILRGKWERATIDKYVVDWSQAISSLENNGNVFFEGRSTIAKIDLTDVTASISLEGMGWRLAQVVEHVTSPSCRVKNFGNSECGVNVTSLTRSLIVSSVDSAEPNRIFTANSTEGDRFFTLGEFTWVSGNNIGVRTVVSSFSEGIFTLFESMPFLIAVGDTFTAIAGCDRSKLQCDAFGGRFIGESDALMPGATVYFES